MKNIFKIFLSTLLVFSFNSCEDSDVVVDQVVANTQAGAVLRTINVLSNTLNRSIPSTSFSVEVEEQDDEGGSLLESVDVFVSIRDLTPDNGTTVKEALIKTIPASAFTTGPVDLPRATISATFGEAEAAMGLDDTQHSPGDLFVFELRLNLTDGRTFGAADAAGIITGGYWASPYKYNTLLLCAPKAGDYTIDMHDSFGDGWQTNGGNGGDGIQVSITDAAGAVTVVEFGMCTPYGDGSFLDTGDCSGTPSSSGFTDASATVTIPVGTAEATWNFPGDQYGEISFEVYAPNGDLLLTVGLGEGAPGLLPVTNCL
jgi:hypothetical protein